MDAEFEKEQIGTLFVWVGALEGGFGGWVVPQGCPPQKVNVPSKRKKFDASCTHVQKRRCASRCWCALPPLPPNSSHALAQRTNHKFVFTEMGYAPKATIREQMPARPPLWMPAHFATHRSRQSKKHTPIRTNGSANHAPKATMREQMPVRPPSRIPTADSANTVRGDMPSTDPIMEATPSAHIVRS